MAEPLAGKRCLVVDDEFLIALDLQEVLERAGADEVVCAGTIADALAALQGGRFDAAVLDLRLGQNGGTSLPVAAALTEVATPFIFLTGMHADNAQARTYPDAPVVEKPYDPQALMAALRRALNGG